MRSTYIIDHGKRLVITAVDGVVGMEGIVEMARRLSADPEFDPGYAELLDLSGVSDVKLTYNQCSTIAELVDPFLPDCRRAIVAPSQAVYGVARMYQSLREGTYVCHDAAEAREWLQLSRAESTVAGVLHQLAAK